MPKAIYERHPEAWRFGLRFIGYLAGLALVFEALEGVFVRFYLKPVSLTASFTLKYLGTEASLDFGHLSQGFCDMAFRHATYRVTSSCTGIFTCIIFAAGVLAYPASGRQKMKGLAVGVPAFFVFGAGRLVLMGLIAAGLPGYIDLFHRYIMVTVGVGFALFLWIWWVDEILDPRPRPSFPA